ncbi:MAG: hypothetical protein ACPL5I_00835 [Thermodesulfobacteriota bacterium]
MKKHRREKKIFKIYQRFSAKGRRLKYSYQFVGQAFMACQIRQGSSPCPTAAAFFHGRITAS